jgi:hypothetical protein
MTVAHLSTFRPLVMRRQLRNRMGTHEVGGQTSSH